METRDQFAFCFGQIKRGPIDAGGTTCEEDPEGDDQLEIITHVINPSGVVTESEEEVAQ